MKVPTMQEALAMIAALAKVAPEHRDRMKRWEHGDFNDTDNTPALAGSDRTILIGQMDAIATAIEELRESPHLWADPTRLDDCEEALTAAERVAYVNQSQYGKALRARMTLRPNDQCPFRCAGTLVERDGNLDCTTKNPYHRIDHADHAAADHEEHTTTDAQLRETLILALDRPDVSDDEFREETLRLLGGGLLSQTTHGVWCIRSGNAEPFVHGPGCVDSRKYTPE